jgi:PTS system fructose-specific IIC component
MTGVSYMIPFVAAGGFLLGIILGLMMAFDMGGPVNKVAYAFGWPPWPAATSRSWRR